MAAKKSSQRKSIPTSKSSEPVTPTIQLPLTQLQTENEELKAQLQETREKLLAVTTEKDSLSAEVEELTKTLFEEANGMVAMEAQARWHVEQAQKRLESELAKTLEMLALESEQTRFLRQLVEQEKSHQRRQDPFLWDIDLFSARLSHDYYDDFCPTRHFNSRDHSGSQEWDRLSTLTAATWQFKQFSQFLDDCILKGSTHKRLDDESLLTLLGHPFMRSLLAGDIEPCLTFPVLERAGRTKSLLKKLIPAMFKNTCVIEPLPRSDLPDSSSQRASPVASIRSFKSVSRPPSPLKETDTVADRSASEGTNSDTTKEETVAIDIPLSPASNALPQASSSLSKSPASLLSRFDSYLTSLVSSEPASPSDKCAFCDCQPSAFRFRINNPTSTPSAGDSPTKSPTWTPLCPTCRSRLVAVASLFTLLRHLMQGHQSHRPRIDIYFDVVQGRRYMFYARAGVDMSFYALSDFESFSRKLQ